MIFKNFFKQDNALIRSSAIIVTADLYELRYGILPHAKQFKHSRAA